MTPKHPISQSKSLSIFPSLLMTAFLLMSCSIPAFNRPAAAPTVKPTLKPSSALATATSEQLSPTPEVLAVSPTSVPTIVPTATAVVIQDTATPAAPSATPVPTVNPVVGMGTIALPPGMTAEVVGGNLQPNEVLTYTLGAIQGQPLTLIMDSQRRDVSLGVFDPNRAALLDPASRKLAWQGVLPTTGIYSIQVTGGTRAESFNLTVKTPQMVSFEAGATSATLNGTTANGYLYSYSLKCSSGQTLNASLNVPASTATINIYGLTSGTVLNANAEINSWKGTLAQSQDYVVEVVPKNGQVVNYALTVSVTTESAISNYPGGKITFTPGITAAVIQGTVLSGQVVTYTVDGDYAQPLILVLESAKRDAYLGVSEADGSVLLDPAHKFSNFQYQLPKADTYSIGVYGGTATDTFTLTVKVPQMITLPDDGTPVVLHGSTWNGYLVDYAIRSSGGTIITAKLDTDASKAFLDIFGIATGVLLSYNDHATSWHGSLDTMQDYVVEVVPRNGIEVSYTLTISRP